MAFSFGFYNSIQGDRKYDATQISKIFDGIINDGVFQSIGNAFMVTPSANGLAVIVGSGRAWLNHTWNLNDSDMLLTLETADILLNRVDTVVLDINNNEESRTNELKILTGTPSEEPVASSLIWENNHKQYAIATIYIPKEAAEVSQDNITYKVGQAPLPWVTGILETVDTTNMIAQWQAQWNQWLYETDLDHDNWEAAHRTEFINWTEVQEAAFGVWYQVMKDQLTTDAAGNLQTQIDEDAQTAFERYYGLTNKVTDINKDSNGTTTEIIEYFKNDSDAFPPVSPDATSSVEIASLATADDWLAKATTTFETDSDGNKNIKTVLVPKPPESGPYYKYTKIVKFQPNSTGGKTITETYTKVLVGGESS